MATPEQDNEAANAVNDAEKGINPVRVPVYQTLQEFHIRVLLELNSRHGQEFPTLKNIVACYHALPLYTEADGVNGNSPAQKAAYFGVTLAEFNQLDSHFGDVSGVSFFVTDSKGDTFKELPFSSVLGE